MRFQRTSIGGRELPVSLRAFFRLIAVVCLAMGAGLPQAWAVTATTTTLAITSGGSVVTTVTSGSVVTLTATVNAGSGVVTPGQVNFCDATAQSCTDIHLLGTAQLTSAGTATLKFRPGVGSHGYKAVFLGTINAAPSTSASASLTVTAVTGAGIQPSTTSITASGVQGNYTLTATVSSDGSVAPTGSVSFVDTSNANAVLATATLAPVADNPGFASGSTALGQLIALADLGDILSFVATGDFNGDGIPDLAVVDRFGDLIVMLGKGDGTFATPLVSEIDLGDQFLANDIAVGDFNGDGKLDLALISQNDDPPTVAILLGNGDGTFTKSQTMDTGLETCCIAIGDFNRDGNLDLAVLSSQVIILLGDGSGTFTPGPTMGTNANPYSLDSIAMGDFNGDGILDLALSNHASNTVTIMLGNGDGTFTTAAASTATGPSPTFITVADLNGDGKPDLAVTTSNNVSILLGNGDGTFTAAPSPVTGSGLGQVTVADFNGDGKPDMAVANTPSNSVTVLFGNGDGTFTLEPSPSTGMGPQFIVAADFNGDGKPDMAVANQGDNSVTVLVAETALASATVNDISPMGLGTHLVDASYGGDTNYAASISSTTALIVGAPSYLLSSTPITIVAGASGTSTITVTPTNGFTGTVSLQCDGGSLLGGGGDVDLPTCSAIAPVSITSKAAATTTLTINTQSGTTPGSYMFGIPIPTPGGGFMDGTAVDVTVTAPEPGPAPSFTLSNTSVSIASPGATGTSTITLTPSGGFTGTVALTCAVTGSPAGVVDAPTCSVSAPTAISGTAPVTATLTISTTGASAAALHDPLRRIVPVGGGVALAALLFCGLPGRRRRLKTLLGLLLFAAVAGSGIGCSGAASNTHTTPTPANPGTTPGNYTATVTGTSGAITAATSVSITVN
jgi:hypothetical protein